MIPNEFELSDEFAGFGGGGSEFVHGGDEGRYVAAFGFGAGEAVLGGPGIPAEVSWYELKIWVETGMISSRSFRIGR